ncbi:hypothetical protein NPIL_522241 [Nephila pilipes]|uniref:Uncharacterized protein n=1 Tax=Nephila pilipes TaxID=299642 RepID=A0A8X6QRL9_NEPPI|nr:hypothetical protein NPIL_522241 [Nephila pilipes]
MGYSVRSINLPFLEQQTVNSLQGDIYPLLRKKGIGQRLDQEVQKPKVSTMRFRKKWWRRGIRRWGWGKTVMGNIRLRGLVECNEKK